MAERLAAAKANLALMEQIRLLGPCGCRAQPPRLRGYAASCRISTRRPQARRRARRISVIPRAGRAHQQKRG
jgi:hypothetical protein